MRPNILRWKPEEIIKGYQIIRDGSRYNLEKALSSEVITKLDIVTYINNRYTEFSNIYEFRMKKGNKIIKLNNFNMDILLTLKQDVLTYIELGHYFKALKRLYSYYLYKYEYRGKVTKI